MNLQMRMAFSKQTKRIRNQRDAKSVEDFTELGIFFCGSGFQFFAFSSAQPLAQMSGTPQGLHFYSFIVYYLRFWGS